VIILDSSFLIAYHNTRDVHHAAAARAMVPLIAGKWGRGQLLEYVFLEVVTVLLARRGRSVATSVGAQLLAAAELDFVPCSDVFHDAFEEFRTQRGDDLSFADAAIVAAAKKHPGTVIATFDGDFRRVAGLTTVP
jgi:predicted nucleic acid-binding protein